jgi:hypothetical protein
VNVDRALRYIAIDPGETNGIAGYNYLGTVLWMGNSLDVIDSLKRSESTFWTPTTDMRFIVENYRVYPGKALAHINSDVKTAQVIGAIKQYAKDRSIPVVLQPAHTKATGFAYLGVKEPSRSSPLSHAKVAHAHGTYWLVENRILDPRSLLKFRP